MSSDVCPFCGKAFKRLKSHLPHCKAAASSKTHPTKRDVPADQTAGSSEPTAALTGPTAKGKKSAQTPSTATSPQSKQSKKVSEKSLTPPPSSSANTSSSSQLLSQSPASKRKTQKLSEEIKTANTPLANAISLLSSQSQPLPPSPTIANPKKKKKSLRALIEAAKSEQVSERSLEGTRSASKDRASSSTQFVADPLSSRTTAQTKANPNKDVVKDNTHPASLSADTKPKAASKIKAPKTKKAAQSLPTKATTSSLDSKVRESSAKAHLRNKFWFDSDEEFEDLSVNETLSKLGSGHQARITLQDAKATLGRVKTTHRSSVPSIINQIQTTDDLNGKIRPDTSLSPVLLPTGNRDVESCLATDRPLSDQQSQTTLTHVELQSVKRKTSKTEQTSLVPLLHDERTKLPSAAAPLPSGHLLSQTSRSKPLPQTLSMNQGLTMGLSAIPPSLSQISGPHLLPPAAQSILARMETLRADEESMREKLQLGIKKQNLADAGVKDALTQRRLGQVRLRELPKWLAYKTPRRPRDVVEMVQRGWQWYYRRYIDVKKGGVGGLGMLLAGYCVLSYIWSYPHIKHDRWRKHH